MRQGTLGKPGAVHWRRRAMTVGPIAAVAGAGSAIGVRALSAMRWPAY